MNQKRKWIIVASIIVLLLIVSVGGFYAHMQRNNYYGESAGELTPMPNGFNARMQHTDYYDVNCIDCFRMTNYLYRTGQHMTSEEIIRFRGETVEELAKEIMQSSLWMCESCAYMTAEAMLSFPFYDLLPGS